MSTVKDEGGPAPASSDADPGTTDPATSSEGAGEEPSNSKKLVSYQLGGKKKMRWLEREVDSGKYKGSLEKLFPELLEKKWHCEYDDGSWIESGEDWEAAVDEFFATEDRVFCVVVISDQSAPEGPFIPSCLRCENCDCKGRKNAEKLRKLPDGYFGAAPYVAKRTNPQAASSSSKRQKTTGMPAPAVGGGVPTFMTLPGEKAPTRRDGLPQVKAIDPTSYQPDSHAGQHSHLARVVHKVLWVLRIQEGVPRTIEELRYAWPGKKKPKVQELNYALQTQQQQGVVGVVQQSPIDPAMWVLLA